MLQIYRKLIEIQVSRFKYQTSYLRFPLKKHGQRVEHIDLQDNKAAHSLYFYIVQHKHATKANPAIYCNLYHEEIHVDWEAVEQDILDSCSIVLPIVLPGYSNRALLKAIDIMIDTGLLIRMGYRGRKFMVNPLDYNKLDAKQCLYLRKALMITARSQGFEKLL